MNTTKLEELYGEINPTRNLIAESIETVRQINEIIDVRLPYLKSRLEANLTQGDSIFSVEAKAEISGAITKVDENIKLFSEVIK